MRDLFSLLAALALTAVASAQSFSETLTVCEIRPGMTAKQVVELLGPPVSQGAEYPLGYEEIDIWPIGWWLNYETDCMERKYPEGHLRPHVGLDREAGSVVFVAGPSIEKDGSVLVDQDSDKSLLETTLGPRGNYGWSGDACYASWPPSDDPNFETDDIERNRRSWPQ